MAILSFKDEEAKWFFKTGKRPRKSGWVNVSDIVRRKLDMLHYAKELKDLKTPPNNRLESLSGDLKGYYSIRVNDQWRIVFKWDSQAYDVQVVDYH
jgi:proteic killer suppression protein